MLPRRRRRRPSSGTYRRLSLGPSISSEPQGSGAAAAVAVEEGPVVVSFWFFCVFKQVRDTHRCLVRRVTCLPGRGRCGWIVRAPPPTAWCMRKKKKKKTCNGHSTILFCVVCLRVATFLTFSASSPSRFVVFSSFFVLSSVSRFICVVGATV